MNKTLKKWSYCWIILISAALFMQCATTTVPLYIDEDYDAQAIDEIIVLPTLDLRVEKEREIEKIDKWMHRQLKNSLKYNKYKVTLVEDRVALNSLIDFSEEEINEADPEWIKTIGPSDKNWIFLPVILDLSSKLTFGSGSNAEISAALYDKNSGKCIWHDKGIGRAGQGGLIGMAMVSANEEQAVLNAAFDCMKSIPKNIK